MRLPAFLLVSLLLTACGPTTPVYDANTLEQARTRQQMEDLLQRMQADLKQARDEGRPTTELEHQLNRLKAKLAATLADDFRRKAEASRLHEAIPLPVLAEGNALNTRLQQLDGTTATRMGQWVQQEAEKTRATLRQLEADIAQTPPLALQKRLQMLQRMEKLSGQRAALLQEELEAGYVTAIVQQAQASMADYRFPEAENLLSQALSTLPNQAQLQQLLQQVRAESMASRFEQALADGQPHQAMTWLQKLSAAGLSDILLERLQQQFIALAQFYSERGRKALERENWASAWADFLQARNVLHHSRQHDDVIADDVATLRKALRTLSVRAKQEGLPGLQTIYLLMLRQWSLHPDELDSRIQQTARETMANAVHRLSISPFRHEGDHPGLGAALSARLTEILLHRLPHDVRLVERDELEAIIRERTLDANRSRRNPQIAPADFLLQGNILDASVEHTEKQSFQTERVQTGVHQVPNPEYQTWLQQRRRDPEQAPPETIEQPVFEDVRYAITLHKNTAVLSASYRLIDAASAKILNSNSINREKTVTDISSEGVQIGQFSRPLKLADLPSDAELLNSLLDEVATAMGDELVQILAHSEREHLAQAQEQARRGNYAEAAELAARAWVVARAKGLSVEAIEREMFDYALQAGI